MAMPSALSEMLLAQLSEEPSVTEWERPLGSLLATSWGWQWALQSG